MLDFVCVCVSGWACELLYDETRNSIASFLKSNSPDAGELFRFLFFKLHLLFSFPFLQVRLCANREKKKGMKVRGTCQHHYSK